MSRLLGDDYCHCMDVMDCMDSTAYDYCMGETAGVYDQERGILYDVERNSGIFNTTKEIVVEKSIVVEKAVLPKRYKVPHPPPLTHKQ